MTFFDTIVLMKKLLIPSLVIIAIFSICVRPTSAQSIPLFPAVSGGNLEIETTPEHPEPNQNIKISVASYSVDITKSTVSWYVNDSLVKSGVALQEIEINTGQPGSRLVVKVSIRNSDGVTAEGSLTLEPAEVDLYFEPITFTPPFYRGKSLGTKESSVKFIAISNLVNKSGAIIPDGQTYYKWSIDGSVDLNNSGVSKNSYLYKGKLISRPVEVSVEASSINSDEVAVKHKIFTTIDPITLFYENNPSLGILFNRSLSSDVNLISREVEINAVPYYFSKDEIVNLNYTWKVNGSTVVDSENANSIVFRRENGSGGNSKIALEILSPKNILQSTNSYLNLVYNENDEFNK